MLVAISDNGIINRPINLEINEVYKADQITDSALKLISGYAETNKKILTLEVNARFHIITMDRIASYLKKLHKPKPHAEKVVEKKANDIEGPAV